MPPTHFKERKDFIFRMIDEEHHKGIKWSKEQMVAKQLFKDYPLDFLSKVAPPFKMNSIMWFRAKKGREYLDRKYKEFCYKPTQEQKVLEFEDKAGEDVVIKKTGKLIDFLSE